MLSADGNRSIPEMERRSGARGFDVCEIAAFSMLFVLLLYFFDLVEVFIEPSSSLNRVVVFSACAIGTMLIFARLPLALWVFRVAWPWLLIVAWLAATTCWAGYPELSRTRVLSFAMIYLAALGIAIGLRSPRTLTATLVAACGVVMIADSVSLDFASSYTDLGVRGIHKHKNAAGLVAILTLIVSAFAVPQLRSFGSRIAAGAIILASLVVLVVTKSKTSLGLAAIAICLLPVYWLWLRYESARLHHLLMTVLACMLVFAAGASGTKLSKIGDVLFGDPTLTNRMAIWAAVEELIAQSPWRGHGFGAIWDVGQEWNSLPGNGYVFYNDAELINEAHNGYLDLILNGGYIALALCWLVTLRALWFSLVLAASAALPMAHRTAFCMMHCLLVIFLVHNMTESSLFFPGGHTNYFFLILLAQMERWKAEFDARYWASHQMSADSAPFGSITPTPRHGSFEASSSIQPALAGPINAPLRGNGMASEGRASAGPARNELPPARASRLFNVRLHALSPEEVLDRILKRDPQGSFAYIVTPNVDHVVRLHKSANAGRHLYEEAWLSLCDSTVLAILARMAGMHLPVVTGSDLVEAIFGRLQPSDRVVVIGCGEDDVEALRRRYGIAAIAHHNPPMGFVDDPKEVQACVDFVAAHPGRFVFLAVGSPQQEIVANHLHHCGRATGLGLCVGSSLRFLSGAERRAPHFARGSGFEWLFRLAQDPRRLWRRYLVDDPLIVRIALRYALSPAFDASTGLATRAPRRRPRRR